MIARWLRRILVGEAAMSLLVAALVGRHGAAAGTAVLWALASFVALNSWPVVAAAVIARGWRARPFAPPRLAAALGEWLAFLAAFMLIQPFERLWMRGDALGPLGPGAMPVLLVHGYLCNRGVWWWLRRGLRRRGLGVATVTLEPPLGGLDGFAETLHARIEALCRETGAARVALVGHSSGGLVCRAYAGRHGTARIGRLVTLGSPHHGSGLARLGLGRSAREMAPGSPWLVRLAAGPTVPPGMLTVWSATDDFVAPPESGRLAGAREIVLPAIGHLALLFSAQVRTILVEELTGARNARRAGTG